MIFHHTTTTVNLRYERKLSNQLQSVGEKTKAVWHEDFCAMRGHQMPLKYPGLPRDSLSRPVKLCSKYG